MSKRENMANITKKILSLVLCAVVFSGIISIKPLARADTLSDLEKQKKDLQNSINSNSQQIKSLQDMINSLDSQTAATQKEISLTGQIIDQKNQQIAATQAQITQKTAELKTEKVNLYETLTTFYENNNNNQSILMTLLGSDSLSSAIDKSKYLEAISGQLTDEINKINQIMADLQSQNQALENQKSDLISQKTDLENQQRNLNIQAQQKNRLLSQANSKQSQLQGDLDNVSAAIYAERRQRGGYTSGGTGGYPWAGADPDGIDPWGFYYRQCTSFAAWYWNAVEGKSWYNTRPGSGSAYNWPALAGDQGYGVYSSPQVGDIVSWPAGGIFGAYGHAAIVVSVHGDGTFRVAQYNWSPLAYSEMDVSGSLAGSARFIR